MPITAGDEAPGPGPAGGRGAPCAGEPAQESLLEEERGEGTARALRAEVTAHGWGRGGMREGMEGQKKIGGESVSDEQSCRENFGRFASVILNVSICMYI